MTKSELIQAYANEADCSVKTATTVVETVLGVISGTLSEGENVMIHKFGNFKIKNCPARGGRNPATGAKIQIPEKNKVTFKPSFEV